MNTKTPTPGDGAGNGTASTLQTEREGSREALIPPEGGVLVPKADLERILRGIEWADAHVGGHAKYTSHRQVVDCLAEFDDVVDLVRALSAAPPISPRGVSEASIYGNAVQDAAFEIAEEIVKQATDRIRSRVGLKVSISPVVGDGDGFLELDCEAIARRLSLPTGSGAWTLADVGITPHISTDPAEVAAFEEALAALSSEAGS